jgi:hypothetical protein
VPAAVLYYYSSVNIMVKSGKVKGPDGANAGGGGEQAKATSKAKVAGKAKASGGKAKAKASSLKPPPLLYSVRDTRTAFNESGDNNKKNTLPPPLKS